MAKSFSQLASYIGESSRKFQIKAKANIKSVQGDCDAWIARRVACGVEGLRRPSKAGEWAAVFSERSRSNAVLSAVLTWILKRRPDSRSALPLISKEKLARPERFERPTLRFVG
jgi:hypothetical protein